MGTGLGWFVYDYRGHRVYCHGGNLNGMRSLAAIVPSLELGVAVLSNRQGSGFAIDTLYEAMDKVLGVQDDEGRKNRRAVLREVQESYHRQGDYALLVNEGLRLAKEKDYPRARRLLEKAVQLDGSRYEAHHGLGALRSWQGDYAGAIVLFNKALECDDFTTYTLNDRARALAALGKLDEAIADVERVLKMAPGNVDGFLLRARYRIEQGSPELAVRDCSALLERDPLCGRAYRTRALAHASLGQWEKAEQDRRRYAGSGARDVGLLDEELNKIRAGRSAP